MGERISIYIDGANFVYGLKSLNKTYSDYHFDFEAFIKKIITKPIPKIKIKLFVVSAPVNFKKNWSSLLGKKSGFMINAI